MKPGTVRIRVLSLGSFRVYDRPTWVKAYDPDDGVARPTLTWDPDEALMFDDMDAAVTRWRAVDPLVPVRDDGKPNRPLTAFTVEFERLTETGGVTRRGA